jgi:hypothetical protein
MMQIEENDSDTFDLVPSKAIFISPWQNAASSTFCCSSRDLDRRYKLNKEDP